MLVCVLNIQQLASRQHNILVTRFSFSRHDSCAQALMLLPNYNLVRLLLLAVDMFFITFRSRTQLNLVPVEQSCLRWKNSSVRKQYGGDTRRLVYEKLNILHANKHTHTHMQSIPLSIFNFLLWTFVWHFMPRCRQMSQLNRNATQR